MRISLCALGDKVGGLAGVDFGEASVFEEVEDDLLVVDALFGHAFGSVLAHAEAVAEAVSLDDEGVWLLFVAFGFVDLGIDGEFGAAEI